MVIPFSTVQKQRLREMGVDPELMDQEFRDAQERDSAFRQVEQTAIQKSRERIVALQKDRFRPVLCELEDCLVENLTKERFVQVTTPLIIARQMLAKMSITSVHPLINQVFWVSENRCLRPMLAPNLYSLLKRLIRLWKKPIRIFEVGPCFRKESRGGQHSNEFTMLNLVELGLPEESREPRLEELIALVMQASGIETYRLSTKPSEVYGDTIDVVSGVEVGSAAMGPHKLDAHWGIFDPWVGVGFGLERLAMVREGFQNIQRVSRSLEYLDGVRLNI
ncbi:MAG: pyrrolysine--tRNA(Pyl) ligase large subunit [Proteobacteria bacterium]|nr:pyrrolysine--tRNA(Pyl) ligase large subunit [Pseudomonadota bacterium]